MMKLDHTDQPIINYGLCEADSIVIIISVTVPSLHGLCQAVACVSRVKV